MPFLKSKKGTAFFKENISQIYRFFLSLSACALFQFKKGTGTGTAENGKLQLHGHRPDHHDRADALFAFQDKKLSIEPEVNQEMEKIIRWIRRKAPTILVTALLILTALQGATVRADGRNYTREDAEVIAKVIWGEARGCDATQQAAVAWCILNRVDSADFPNSISEVVNQKYQPGGARDSGTGLRRAGALDHRAVLRCRSRAGAAGELSVFQRQRHREHIQGILPRRSCMGLVACQPL